MALEGRVESIPAQAAPAPELPSPVQEMLRGYFHKLSPGSQAEGAKKEGMNFYLSAFMACANTWREKAKAKASEAFAIQALEKENASLKEEKETLARRWARQEEAYKDSLKLAQKAKEEASKRLLEVGQIVPLRVQVVDLKDAVQTSKAQQKKLEDHCVDREQKLAKTEAALEAKTNSCDLLTAENTTLRAEMVKALKAKDQELVAALAAKDQELATQAEQFKKAEQELVQEATMGFADGFAEALVQAACSLREPWYQHLRVQPLQRSGRKHDRAFDGS